MRAGAVELALTAGPAVFALRGITRVNAAAADVGGHGLPSVRCSLTMGKAVAEHHRVAGANREIATGSRRLAQF